MRAITIRQPWASLISIGAKTFEPRSFPPPTKLIGQRIAIHASVRPCWRNLLDVRKIPQFRAICEAMEWLPTVTEDLASDLPHGAVVCTAVIAGAYYAFPVDGGGIKLLAPVGMGPQLPPDRIHHTDPFGDYTPGRWAWHLTDVQPLAAPEPAKGKQGWWEWEPTESAAIAQYLKENGAELAKITDRE